MNQQTKLAIYALERLYGSVAKPGNSAFASNYMELGNAVEALTHSGFYYDSINSCYLHESHPRLRVIVSTHYVWMFIFAENPAPVIE